MNVTIHLYFYTVCCIIFKRLTIHFLSVIFILMLAVHCIIIHIYGYKMVCLKVNAHLRVILHIS